MTAVADSSPLVILTKLGCLDFLNRVFPRVYISNEVHYEVVVAGAGLPGASEVSKAESVLAEIEFLKDTDVFSNLELLKMWSETTPKAIFPQRKIGALREGYEANCLVLEGNPIQDFGNVKRIKMRLKQGDPLK